MSHELRHPLNMIQINIELLSRLPELRQSATSLRAAGLIRAAVVSQAKLIDDLLDMSRVRTGKLTLSVAPVDLGKMVEAIADVARSDPATRNMAITVKQEDQGLMASADAVRLEQVLMNLLSNAIKFTPLDGSISLTVARDNGQARIDITDSGQGIAPGAVVHIANSGKQGLDMLEKHDIDLLISDISMPEMDGCEFLQAARRMPRYRTLPAIAISGLGRQKDIARARESGFAAYLGKPMSMDRLTAIVSEVLEQYRTAN